MRRTLAVLIVIAAGSVPAAAQSSFSVDPLRVNLSAENRSAVVSITNPSARELRFEIKAFTWDQAPPADDMQLAPTQEIVAFPPLVTIKPRTTQRVRIGTTATAGAMEKSYRLMVEELPDVTTSVAANQVNVRARVGIPVFLAPTKTALSGRLDSVVIKGRTVSVTLTNTGTVHAMVDNVVIRGMAGTEEMIFEEALQGWYVLPGKTRVWTYTMQPALCRRATAVEVEVFAHDKELKRRADVPAGACTP
jgi:fimbrial chaperone protein